MTLMLQYLSIVSALIHLSLAELRYVLDNDNDLDRYFAFPIDQCIKVSILSEKYVRYTCEDHGTSGIIVVKRLYDGDGPDCGNLIADQTILYWTEEDDKSPCGGPKFSCTGDDRWVNIGFHISSCNTNPILDIPVVMGCYCGTITTSYETTCDKEPLSGSMVHYTGTECAVVDRTEDLNECLYATSNGAADIYSQMTECRLTDPTADPTTMPSQASLSPSTAVPSLTPTAPETTADFSPDPTATSDCTRNSWVTLYTLLSVLQFVLYN
eukprot:880393_1